MINSVNSYLNYNYTNSLNNESSKTKTLNKENSNTNLNQRNLTNTSNQVNNNTILSLNQTNNTKDINNTSNLVSDVSQAVDKVLGYGVDKEGFFTSDFNEAAGLPKDYRIYAQDAESFVNWEIGDRFFYSARYSVDFAKTIANAYKVFSQLSPQTSNSSLSKEEIESIPFAFTMDKNYNITQTFDKKAYEAIVYTKDRINVTFNTFTDIGFDKISVDNIFNNSNGDVKLNKFAYMNKDGSVDKGGVLMALLNSQLYGATGALLEGDTKLFGKLTYDKNISDAQRKDFQDFMNANKMKSAFMSSSNDNVWVFTAERLSMKLYIKRSEAIGNGELTQQASDFDKEYNEMINSNMSLDEFKTKYLDLKKRHDEFVKTLEKEEQAKGINWSLSGGLVLNIPQNQTQEKQETNKTFKPIQGESKNKTYTNNYMNETLKKLLENKFNEKQLLEMLFGIKSNDDDTDNVNFRKIISQMGLNNIKGVDIKA